MSPTPKTWTFASAPNLHPPKLLNDVKDAQLPGYVMTANFYDVTKPPLVGQSGPLILDGKLDPVWFAPVPIADVANNLQAQRYHGRPVLTYWQGQVTATGLINSGTDVVLNQHYQPIAHISGKDGWTITMHEIAVQGDDLFATVNKNVPHDLSHNGGVNNGVIVDSGVQEINIRTGKVVRTWDALKHIPPGDSRVQPPSNGFPWDAYHINSISLQPPRADARLDARHLGAVPH